MPAGQCHLSGEALDGLGDGSGAQQTAFAKLGTALPRLDFEKHDFGIGRERSQRLVQRAARLAWSLPMRSFVAVKRPHAAADALSLYPLRFAASACYVVCRLRRGI
jgi:hypothetical protein